MAVILRTPPELEAVWSGGSLDLLGVNDTDYGPVSFAALGEGTDWGNPESVRRALSRALSDGVATVADGTGNRTITVRLRVEAADGAALAGGEAVLHALERAGRVELRWRAPNEFAAAAVFLVDSIVLTHEMDDLAENRCVRFYVVTLSCLPFARSLTPFMIEALPPAVDGPATVETLTSTAGWSGPFMTYSFSTGVVTGVGAPNPRNIWQAIYAPPTPWTLTKEFFAVVGSLPASHTLQVSATLTGAWVTLKRIGSDGTKVAYQSPANPTIARLQFIYGAPVAPPISITRFEESDSMTGAATKQSLRYLEIPGSAPAPSAIAIASRDGESLGETVVYTGPSYDPRLSIGRVVEEVGDTGSNYLSGAVSINRTSFTFYRKASDFPPGPFNLHGNPVPVGGGSVSLEWTITVELVSITDNALVLSDPVAEWTTVTQHVPGEEYRLLPMGVATLPGAALPDGSPHYLKFVATPSAAANWDEGLLFSQAGTLMILADVGAAKVWVEPATLDHDARVLYGNNVYENAVPASLAGQLKAWDGAMTLDAGPNSLFLSTGANIDPSSSGSGHACWHTHPAS